MADLKARLTLDASQVVAESKKAGDAVGSIGKKGSTELQSAGKSAKSMSDSIKAAIPHLAAAAATVTAVRAGLASAGVVMAQFKLEAAVASGSVTEIMRAQLGVKEATRNVVAQIPFIGSAAAEAMRMFDNSESIQKSIENIKRIEEATKRFHEMNRQMMIDNAVAEARQAGKSAAEIARIQQGFRAQDREETLREMRKNRGEADIEWSKAKDQLRAAQKEFERVRGPSGFKEGWDPFGWGEALAAKDLHAAIQSEFDQRKKYMDAAKQVSDLEANISREAAVAEKDIRDKDLADKLSAQKTYSDYWKSETRKRQEALDQEYAHAHAAAVKYGLDVQFVDDAYAEKQKALAQEVADKKRAIEEQELARKTAAANEELSAWRRQADERMVIARRLSDQLVGIERSRQAGEEAWYDRKVRMNMEGKSEGERKSIARGAARDYIGEARASYGAGDYEEARRRLGRAMEYAGESGDRKLMERIQQGIRETFALQKAATENQLAENRQALDGLNAQLETIKQSAASMKVVLDTSEAEAKLRALGLTVKGPAQAKARGGFIGRGFATGGPVGTDTVPAWLTPGEFVVSRAAAHAHRGLLEAINSGSLRIPASAQRFATGGAVGVPGVQTNDNRQFTIHLPASGSAPQGARELARGILTEIRRLEARGN